jgi:hypothetical protein
MWLQTRDTAKIAEKFPSRYKLHNEIQITCILCEALELDLPY